MSHVHFTREQLLSVDRIYHKELWKVRLQDIDAAGIVFFAKILEACHDAYMNFFQKEHHEIFSKQGTSFHPIAPIVHCEADFIRPLKFLDSVEVQIVKVFASTTKYMFGYRLVDLKDHKPLAVAQTVHVVVDPQTFSRIQIPIEVKVWLEKMANWEGQ